MGILGGSDLERLNAELIKSGLNSTIGTDSFLPLNEQHGKAVFTENGTFEFKKGITYLISAIAAGTNGENGTYGTISYNKVMNGGNGGEFVIDKVYKPTATETIPITVGTGNTIIGSILTLLVGKRTPAQFVIVPSMVASTTPLLYQKANWDGMIKNFIVNGSYYAYATGGVGSPFGAGGDGGVSDYSSTTPATMTPATDGQGYGSGGGGGAYIRSAPGSQYLGGKGKPGIVIIEW